MSKCHIWGRFILNPFKIISQQVFFKDFLNLLFTDTLQRFPITNRTQLCSFSGLINAPPVEPCLSLQPPRARPIILVLCKIPHGHMHHAISLLTRITFLFFSLWLTPSHLPPTFISGVVKCYSMHTNPSQYLTLCIIIIFWCVLTRL